VHPGELPKPHGVIIPERDQDRRRAAVRPLTASGRAWRPVSLHEGEGHHDAVGMSAIDGLIAALVAAPVFVHPDEWLPLIFGGRLNQSLPPSLLRS
jgi:hypothetical protein